MLFFRWFSQIGVINIYIEKAWVKSYYNIADICDALRDLVLLVQFKQRENTQGGVLLLVKLQAYRTTH